MPGSRRIGQNLAWLLIVLWLVCCVDVTLPHRLAGWGAVVSVSCDRDGSARLYYDLGEGFSEQHAISRPFVAGERQRLYFPLPAADLMHLRFDPFEGPGSGHFSQLEFTGPAGAWSGERATLRLKPGLDIEEWSQSGAEVSFTSAGSDPQFYISFKPKPQMFPVTASRWLRVAVAGLTAVLATLAIRCAGALLISSPGWLIVVFGFTWLTGLFVFPQRVLPEAWFWLAVMAPMPIVLLLNLPLAVNQLRSIWRSSTGFTFLLMLAYWAFRACFLDPSGEPGRWLVLSDLAAIAGLAWTAAISFRGNPTAMRWTTICLGGALFALASWQALEVMVEFYRSAPLTNRLHPSHQEILFPLYRPNSGSACFGILLVAWIAAGGLKSVAVQKCCKPASTFLAASSLVLSLPIVIYLVLSQSRSALLALLSSAIFIALVAKPRRDRIGALAVFTLTLLLALGNVAARVEHWRTDGSSPVPTAEAEGSSSNGVLRSAAARPSIWRSYLLKSSEKWLFGHGFAGDQALFVDFSPDSLGEDQDRLGSLRWNPHCVHLSTFYFGGVAGFALHTGALTLVWLGLVISYRRTGAWPALAIAAALIFGCCQLTFESTLMAYAKDAVLLRRPNEFWLLFWLPLCLGVGWLAAHRCAIGTTNAPNFHDPIFSGTRRR